jgi:hypothetical protein
MEAYIKEVEEELQELVRLGSSSAKQALKYIKTKEGKESLAEKSHKGKLSFG